MIRELKQANFIPWGPASIQVVIGTQEPQEDQRAQAGQFHSLGPSLFTDSGRYTRASRGSESASWPTLYPEGGGVWVVRLVVEGDGGDPGHLLLVSVGQIAADGDGVAGVDIGGALVEQEADSAEFSRELRFGRLEAALSPEARVLAGEGGCGDGGGLAVSVHNVQGGTVGSSLV